MTKLTILIAAAALLSLGTALFGQYGQQTPEQRMPQQQTTSPQATQQKQKGTDWDWQMDKKATLTGCLMKESSTVGALTGTAKKGTFQEYMLKRQGTEQEIAVKGMADFSKHTDHIVQLSGTFDREDGKEVFKVAQIKHVANSCAEKTGLGKATGKSKETGTRKQTPEPKY